MAFGHPPRTTPEAPKLSDKAVLCKVSISQWGATKTDKEAGKKVTELFNADPKAGRYVKDLIDMSEIRRITSVGDEARFFHYDNTLHWEDNGWRLLPAANLSRHKAGMEERKKNWQEIVDAFCERYEELREEAKVRLGSLWKASDYPPASEICSRYSFEIQYIPLPDASKFRISILTESEIASIRKETEEKLKRAEKLAMGDAFKRLHEAVSHMAERLGTEKAIFRDSLVTNLAELVEVLPALNVAKDPELDKLIGDAKETLLKYEPDRLRHDPKARGETAAAAGDIIGKFRRIGKVVF